LLRFLVCTFPANGHFVCVNSSDLLRAKDVALLLGVSERTALRFMKASDGISSFRLGPRHIRTTRRDVDAFIERRQEEARRAAMPAFVNIPNRPWVNT
jgi:predicted DNA-binding transcriptional regulator AlpA